MSDTLKSLLGEGKLRQTCHIKGQFKALSLILQKQLHNNQTPLEPAIPTGQMHLHL